jgi:dihydroorotate dehydrogenase (fumarate)
VLPELSTFDDLRLPLRWIAILYRRVAADFALNSGVHTARDVLKAMLAGARVAMLTSELLAHGIERLAAILKDLQAWMAEYENDAITQMQGSMSQQAVAQPAAFERAKCRRSPHSIAVVYRNTRRCDDATQSGSARSLFGAHKRRAGADRVD